MHVAPDRVKKKNPEAGLHDEDQNLEASVAGILPVIIPLCHRVSSSPGFRFPEVPGWGWHRE